MYYINHVLYGGKLLNSESITEIRSTTNKLPSNKLPVLGTEAKVLQEGIVENVVSRRSISSLETGKREMALAVFGARIAFSEQRKNRTDARKHRRTIKRDGNVFVRRDKVG
jgi:hypothetical protein